MRVIRLRTIVPFTVMALSFAACGDSDTAPAEESAPEPVASTPAPDSAATSTTSQSAATSDTTTTNSPPPSSMAPVTVEQTIQIPTIDGRDVDNVFVSESFVVVQSYEVGWLAYDPADGRLLQQGLGQNIAVLPDLLAIGDYDADATQLFDPTGQVFGRIPNALYPNADSDPPAFAGNREAVLVYDTVIDPSTGAVTMTIDLSREQPVAVSGAVAVLINTETGSVRGAGLPELNTLWEYPDFAGGRPDLGWIELADGSIVDVASGDRYEWQPTRDSGEEICGTSEGEVNDWDYGAGYWAVLVDCENDGGAELRVVSADGTEQLARFEFGEVEPRGVAASANWIALAPDFYDAAGLVRLYSVAP